MSAWSRFATIGSMYMAQTFATAFVSHLMPAIYRDQGLPLERFWILSVALIPFWFRWAWAPLVDRNTHGPFGPRKSWFLPCTALGVLTYVGLSLVDPTIEQIWWLMAVFGLQALVVSTQEVAVDAYMVDNIAPGERGAGSGVKTYMEAVAEVMALAGLAFVYDRYGWDAAVSVAAALFVFFFIPALVRREKPLHAAARTERSAAKPSVARFLRRRDSYVIIALLAAGGIAQGMYFPMMGAFLVDAGLAVTEVGAVLGVVVVIGMFIGATVAMTAVNRLGTKLTVALLAMAAFPAFVPAVYIATQESLGLVPIILGMSIPTSVLALMYVVFVVARLSWTSTLQAGTDYSIQSAIFRGGATAAVGVGGLLAAWLGWIGFFVAYAAIVVAVLLVFFVVSDPLDRLVARRVEREQSLARTGRPADTGL